MKTTTKFVVTALCCAVYGISASAAFLPVTRYDRFDAIQNASERFDPAFAPGAGAAFADGDRIVISSNVAASATVAPSTFTTGAFTISSDDPDILRTVAMTNGVTFFRFSGGKKNTITTRLERVAFSSGAAQEGGAISSAASLVITGNGVFSNNTANNYGGAVFAGYFIEISGANVFSANTSDFFGGAVFSWYDGKISGTNVFTGNTADMFGGAVSANGNIEISGANVFSANRSDFLGGAIYTDREIGISGENVFSNNTAQNGGGAIYAWNGVEISGKSVFTGNTAGGRGNDIVAENGAVVFAGGVHSLDGGIRTDSGALAVTNGASVKFEAGSATAINGDFLLDGATLSLALNASNRQNSADAAVFPAGATSFSVAAQAQRRGGGRLRVLISNALPGETYLAAAGDFSAFADAIVPIVNGGAGAATVLEEKLSDGIWLRIDAAFLPVTRYDRFDAIQNASERFDPAFAPGAGAAFADGDRIVISSNVAASATVVPSTFTTGVFTISSDDPDILRTVAMTNGDRFFDFGGEGRNTITTRLERVAFSGGDTSEGGAIRARAGLVITGNGVFTGNTAGELGGAVCARNNVEISGKNVFSANTSDFFGGAVWANNVEISGTNVFTGNTAQNVGGAVYANESIEISGTNVFTGNTADVFGGGAIYTYGVASISGENVFTGNTAKNFAGGAIYTYGGVNLSGTNVFIGNTAKNLGGGAIHTYGGVGISGENVFTGNTAGEVGGAVWANGTVEISGKSVFTGNTAGGRGNDIVAENGTVVFSGGVHSLDGGILTVSGALAVTNGASVKLEAGSATAIDGDFLLDGATLSLALNASNRQNSADAAVFPAGATSFSVAAQAQQRGGGRLRVLISNALPGETYLAAAGDFSAFADAIVPIVNGGAGAATVLEEKLSDGIWLRIDAAFLPVTRYDRFDAIQNASERFDPAFAPGAGAAFADGDRIVISSNVAASATVAPSTFTTGVFTVSSDDPDILRTVAMTSVVRFFNFGGEGRNTITTRLERVAFSGGRVQSDAGDLQGGAIRTRAGLVITGSGVFTNNISACDGGAIYASSVSISGTNVFLDNNTPTDGGAIYAYGGASISGKNVFNGNDTYGNGGAIYAYGGASISGENVFNGNDTYGDGGAIYAYGGASISGKNVFNGNDTYSNGGAVSARNNVEISGTNVFTGNTAKHLGGGAIHTYGGVGISGENVFTGNTAGEVGGAVWANGTVEISGKSVFTGNTAGGRGNDIVAENGTVVFAGGVHSLDGGIRTVSGALAVTNGASVKFEAGSATAIDGDFLLDGATLSLALNASNRQNSADAAVFPAGATSFSVAAQAQRRGGGTLRVLISNALLGETYLAAAGDFSAFADAIVPIVNGGAGAATVLEEKLSEGIWLTLVDDGLWRDITFAASGGTTVTGGQATVTVRCSSKGYAFPDVTRPGYRLAGWYDGWTNRARKASAALPFLRDEAHTLHAKWTAASAGGIYTFSAASSGTVTLTGASSTVPAAMAMPDRRGNGVDGDFVTAIGSTAFFRNQTLAKLWLPLYSTSIGEMAFAYCANLKSVIFPPTTNWRTGERASLTIGARAFARCVSLGSITLPETTAKIGDYAFSECFKLGSVTFSGTTVPEISAKAFYRCGRDVPGGLTIWVRAWKVADFTAAFRALDTGGVTVTVKAIPGSEIRLHLAAPSIAARPSTRTVTAAAAGGAVVTLPLVSSLAPEEFTAWLGENADAITVEYRERLDGQASRLTPTVRDNGDGTATLTVETPAQSESGFFRARVIQ